MKQKKTLGEAELAAKCRQLQSRSARCKALGRGGLGLTVVLILAAWALRPGAAFAAVPALLFLLSLGALGRGILLREKAENLLREQLGSFVQATVEQNFGPGQNRPELRIDEERLRAMQLREGQWTDSRITEFHEGCYREIPFSAANLLLEKVYTTGAAAERMQHRDRVFRGLVLCCKAPAPQDRTRWEAAAQSLDGTLAAACRTGPVLALAIETDYRFAALPENSDLGDPNAVRQALAASVRRLNRPLEQLAREPSSEEEEKQERSLL